MANQKIKGCYPLKVEEIVFEDGSTMKDKEIMLLGDFIVVDTDEGAPTMYNTRTVSELRRVQEIRPQTRNVMW